MGPSTPSKGAVLVLIGGLFTFILFLTELFPESCHTDYGYTSGRCKLSPLKYAHMWNAGIFLLTGIIGVAAIQGSKVAHRKAGLRTGFIVLSTLIVVLFGPSHTALGFFQGMFAEARVFSIQGWLHAAVGLFVSISSMFAASCFCCCMPIEEYEVEGVPVQGTSTYSVPSISDLPRADTSNIILNDYLQHTTNSPSEP